ncbi:hypothetical protein Tsubulata_043088 [Turnera subulata]|uniref:Uncharacterized protein n=1 Tax=Turnera subulata TaxID=218843 RepID=A0A9Q0GH36_9ROSI|nr:hypothetical protein Tsubulata_043088 [Turnera subulata]
MASSHHPSFASADAGSSTSGSAVVSRSDIISTEICLVNDDADPSLATGDADPSEEMVLGHPQPFKGDEVFEEGEKALYTRATLPGAFKKRAKLWVQYGKMHLSAIQVKALNYRAREGEKTITEHVFNEGGWDSIPERGMFILTIFTGGKKKPSSGEGQSVLYTKVQLPGIYGEAVKLWVKSGVTFFGEEIKKGVAEQGHNIHMGEKNDSLMLMFISRLNDTGSLSLPLKRNPEQPQPSMAAHLPSGSTDGGSSSAGNASVVLGEPQPFNGYSAFKKGERLKYTKVELPGFFKRDVKLWVKFGELYLMAMEMKPKALKSSNRRDAMKTHYYNHGRGASMYNGSLFLSLARREDAIPSGKTNRRDAMKTHYYNHGRGASMYNGSLFLSLARREDAIPSDEKNTFYSKVELPSVYGESAKMWVRSDDIVVNSLDIKAEDACSRWEQTPSLKMDDDGGKIDDSLTVVLVFNPKMRE